MVFVVRAPLTSDSSVDYFFSILKKGNVDPVKLHFKVKVKDFRRNATNQVVRVHCQCGWREGGRRKRWQEMQFRGPPLHAMP